MRQGTAILRDALSESPGWTYGQADQMTDGASGAITVDVAQVSAKFGTGAWASLDLTL